MIPQSFGYRLTRSPEEAVEALTGSPGSRIIAGGQSLIPLLKRRQTSVDGLVDISRIPDLRFIDVAEDAVTLGALATHRDVELDDALARVFPLFREVANVVADPPVRNRGTVCGSVCFGDPAGDWPALALALEATLNAFGPTGQRAVSALDLYHGPMETSLSAQEMVTHVTFPLPKGPWGAAYRKFRHPSSGYALVGVAVLVRLNVNDGCAECRLAITGAGRVAVRARSAEEALRAASMTREVLYDAAEAAVQDVQLGSDVYADETYRARLIQAEVRRALETAVERARRQ